MTGSGSIGSTFTAILITIGIAIALIAVLILSLKKILDNYYERSLISNSKNFTFFEVRLPNNNEVEIKAAEQMFAWTFRNRKET
ncbi:MAG: hypothetical protein Q9M91_05740 [Candidatus Dojkabacteria bacterium]|nr:hypothetical protein [Candidatus Dojkabacteria bacterium]